MCVCACEGVREWGWSSGASGWVLCPICARQSPENGSLSLCPADHKDSLCDQTSSNTHSLRLSHCHQYSVYTVLRLYCTLLYYSVSTVFCLRTTLFMQYSVYVLLCLYSTLFLLYSVYTLLCFYCILFMYYSVYAVLCLCNTLFMYYSVYAVLCLYSTLYRTLFI